MNKQIKELCKALLLSVCTLGVTVAAHAGGFSKPFAANFLNNGTYLCVSNATPFNYENASNAYFWSWSTGTNIYAAYGTNSSGVQYDQAVVDVPLVPDYNSDLNPTLAIEIVIGRTNNYPLPSVMTPSENGYLNNTNPLVYVPIFANAALSTNTVTFTFVGVTDEGFPESTFFPQNILTVSLTCTNNALTILSTNLVPSFLQGDNKLRLESISSAQANSGTVATDYGAVINAVRVKGWSP